MARKLAFTLVMSPDDHAALAKASKNGGTSRAEIIRRAVARELTRMERASAKQKAARRSLRRSQSVNAEETGQ